MILVADATTVVYLLLVGLLAVGLVAVGWVTRRWWIALIPYVLVLPWFIYIALGDGDGSDGDLFDSHEQVVAFAAVALGIVATVAAVLVLAGVSAGRLSRRSTTRSS